MKLRFSPMSPFVRKVRLVAHLVGAADKIELVPTNPWDPETDLPRTNPLGKVPALELDDGTVLCDSSLICEYLDATYNGGLYPKGDRRWPVLARYCIADGVITAAVARIIETVRRPEGVRWEGWLDRQTANISRGLDSLESSQNDVSGPWTIAEVTVICTLGYLDIRAPNEDWRATHPKLAAWYETVKVHPACVATELRPPT